MLSNLFFSALEQVTKERGGPDAWSKELTSLVSTEGCSLGVEIDTFASLPGVHVVPDVGLAGRRHALRRSS